MRKVMAVVAAPGLIAGVYIFIASFFGLTIDKLGAKALLLHLGIFAIGIPLVVVERSDRNFERGPTRIDPLQHPCRKS